MTLKFFGLIVLSAWTAAPAWAQDVSFRALGVTEKLPAVFLNNGRERVPLEFETTQPSEPVQAPYSNPLMLYGSADKSVEKTLAKLRPPADTKSILLLGWMTSNGPRYIATKDKSASGQDDWLLINSTTKSIALQIGKQTEVKRLLPGVCDFHNVRAKSGTGAAVVIGVQNGDQWKSVYESYWAIYEKRRCIVLIYESDDVIRAKVIAD